MYFQIFTIFFFKNRHISFMSEARASDQLTRYIIYNMEIQKVLKFYSIFGKDSLSHTVMFGQMPLHLTLEVIMSVITDV